MSRSATRTMTRRPLCARPTPTWWSLVPCRRVKTPVLSILSWRTRVWGAMGYLSGSGDALVRASKAFLGGTMPRAEWGRVSLVADEVVDLPLELGDGGSRVLLAQPPLQGLVEPLDLALGLGVVGLAVLDGDTQGGELGLEAAAAVAELGGEDAAVVGQHRGRQPEMPRTLVERGHHVGHGRHRQHDGDRHHPGVVVHEVEDLDTRPIGQGPVGHVRLPRLVRQVRLA